MAGSQFGTKKWKFNDVFISYVISNHKDELQNILLAPDTSKHYAVVINALQLFSATSMEIAQELLHKSRKVLPHMDSAMKVACSTVYENNSLKGEMVLKPQIHARFSGLPACPEVSRNFLPLSLDNEDFLSFSGTVIRKTLGKVFEPMKEYFCTKCKFSFVSKADVEKYYCVDKPVICPNPNKCYSKKFTATDEPGDVVQWKDYQEIRIQERVQALSIRSIPRTMWVILEDDLVDSCQPGDDITVVGTVFRRWHPFVQNVRYNIELAIKANHIQVNNDQRSKTVITDILKKEISDFWHKHRQRPLVGRDEILQSFCPQMYGLYQVKLAVALILAGGVSKVDDSGTKIRGESHLLLIGDPGTGKSQFLKYAAKIFPRSVLTNGMGSTSAGLTVTAVKDGGEWQLEAGALVLADGGICCIDEFNSIKEQDRGSILEAMEQQTISVAKAGLVCELNSRCAVIAATNPKGNYDPNAPITVNVALSSPLLSRFDLILVLLDSKNDDWDNLISTHILHGSTPSDMRNMHSTRWTTDKMQCYFCLIKALKPVMSPDAHTILQRYYLHHRQASARSAAQTTVRMLESLIRLSEAHAKLLFRSEVTILDAVTAIILMESSMQASSFINKDVLHTTFPEDPEQEYRQQAEVVLKKLGLDDILSKEIARINDVKNTSQRPPDTEVESMNSVATSDKVESLENIDTVVPATPSLTIDASRRIIVPISSESERASPSTMYILGRETIAPSSSRKCINNQADVTITKAQLSNVNARSTQDRQYWPSGESAHANSNKRNYSCLEASVAESTGSNRKLRGNDHVSLDNDLLVPSSPESGNAKLKHCERGAVSKKSLQSLNRFAYWKTTHSSDSVEKNINENKLEVDTHRATALHTLSCLDEDDLNLEWLNTDAGVG